MAKKKEDKQQFGDIVENHELVKRTLMVAAFPALIKEVKKGSKTTYNGFLPGFEFAEVDDVVDEDECVETLQDMLDDEVEELVVFGKSLPYVDEDDVLMEKYPEHKIVYLDINVYATPEELEYYDACTHDCASCAHSAECHDEHCDCCEDEYDDCCCEDDDCDCGHENYHHEHCSCGCEDDECDCNENCGCEDNCNCYDEECSCSDEGCNGNHKHKEDCCCGDSKDHECKCKESDKKSAEKNKNECNCSKQNGKNNKCKNNSKK